MGKDCPTELLGQVGRGIGGHSRPPRVRGRRDKIPRQGLTPFFSPARSRCTRNLHAHANKRKRRARNGRNFALCRRTERGLSALRCAAASPPLLPRHDQTGPSILMGNERSKRRDGARGQRAVSKGTSAIGRLRLLEARQPETGWHVMGIDPTQPRGQAVCLLAACCQRMSARRSRLLSKNIP